MKEIYTNRQANVQKSQWYSAIEASSGQERSLHAEIDRSVHAPHRRAMEHAFTPRSLKSLERDLVTNVQTFLDLIAQSSKDCGAWSEPFNMSEWSTYLNYDIMGDLVFGRRFYCLTTDAHRFVPRLLMNSAAFVYTVCLDATAYGRHR